MANDQPFGQTWMRDGDRLMQRAERRLATFESDGEPRHLEMATHDFACAAQMYVTAAFEYQGGRSSYLDRDPTLDDAVRVLSKLEGRLRWEGEAAWHVARERLPPGRESSSYAELEQARTFAESLRDRFAHAVPELVDRSSGPEPARELDPSRSR